MKDTEPILEARDLCLQRGGVTVVSFPSLAVQEGEILALIGPNGSGKSSLLLSLACLLPWKEGFLTFRGHPVDSRSAIQDYRRRIAMVFQEPLLFDNTVYDNVAAGLKIRGVKNEKIRSLVKMWLDRFGIAHLERRHAMKLSGGEAQRTSLARALAFGPEIIFLDEPLSSLDPPTREGLIEDLRTVLKETKTTAVMATHDRLEALRLADRLAFMRGGSIVQIGSPADVMLRPADETVASFVGTETILAGEVVASGSGTVLVDVSGERIEAVGDFQTGTRVFCCIRPENVSLSVSPLVRTGVSTRNFFPGTVEKTTPLGLFHRVHVNCRFPLCAYVTSSSLSELPVEEGGHVYASFKATAVHLIKR